MTEPQCVNCLNFRRAERNERFDKCLRKMFLNGSDRIVLDAAIERETDCRGEYFIDAAIVAMMD
jgi:hypothetical protein